MKRLRQVITEKDALLQKLSGDVGDLQKDAGRVLSRFSTVTNEFWSDEVNRLQAEFDASCRARVV
jgi:hypothetical protein